MEACTGVGAAALLPFSLGLHQMLLFLFVVPLEHSHLLLSCLSPLSICA